MITRMLDDWLPDDYRRRRPQLAEAAWWDRQGRTDIAVEVVTMALKTETDHDVRFQMEFWRGVVTSDLRSVEDTVRAAHEAAMDGGAIAGRNRPRADPPAPRRASPTVTQKEMGGVTERELVTAMAMVAEQQRGGPYDPTLKPNLFFLEQGDPLGARLAGRLVRNEYGRLGVRDETTGKTILFDRGSLSDVTWAEFARNLGEPVHISGVVRGWGRELTTISIESPVTRAAASTLNHGLRLFGVTAQLVVRTASTSLGRVGRTL